MISPLLTCPKGGGQGGQKIRKTKLKSTLITWSVKIQPKLNKIWTFLFNPISFFSPVLLFINVKKGIGTYANWFWRNVSHCTFDRSVIHLVVQSAVWDKSWKLVKTKQNVVLFQQDFLVEAVWDNENQFIWLAGN